MPGPISGRPSIAFGHSGEMSRSNKCRPNGKNCALTYGYGSSANAENYKTAKIRPSGGSTDSDHGWFKYYAGPV